MSSPLPKKKNGLALTSATVALNPARAVTSHLRRHYARRYHGKFRFAPWVFLLDMSLLGLVAFLIGINIYLVRLPSPVAGFGLYLSAPPVMSGTPLSLDAEVVSRETTLQKNVSLTWELPSGTEILSATPPLSDDHQAFLGDLAPGARVHSRLVVRLFVPPGSVSFAFRILTGDRTLSGSEERPVARSGLELAPLLHPTHLAPGALVPMYLKNNTHQPLETVDVTLEGGAQTDDGRSHLSFNTLPPYAERVFLMDPRGASSFRVSALSHAVPLAVYSFNVDYPSIKNVPQILLKPSVPEQPLEISVQTSSSLRLLVFHPGLPDQAGHTKILDIPAGTQRITLPVAAPSASTVDRWFVLPFTSDLAGVSLGALTQSPITTPFKVTSFARYYASTGGQLGIGPLPPRVGEVTKYWVSWKLDALTNDLSQLSVSAPLPPGVTFTGRKALPNGGEISVLNQKVTWTLPFVPASSEGASVSFELALTPTTLMRGQIPVLLEEATASATENRSQILLQAQAEALDTSLVGDERAAGKGVVR